MFGRYNRNSERVYGLKGFALYKYLFEYIKMVNPDNIVYLGNDWCTVTKKEIYKASGHFFILWLKTENQKYSGFIFADREDYDRAKTGHRFARLSVVHNPKGNVYKFTKNLTVDGAINEIVKEAKKYRSYMIGALIITIIYIFLLFFLFR